MAAKLASPAKALISRQTLSFIKESREQKKMQGKMSTILSNILQEHG
jgi:hypothetical protein